MDLWQVSRLGPDHVQPLESSNYKFEPSINNVLLSLRLMVENPRQHEQVYCIPHITSCPPSFSQVDSYVTAVLHIIILLFSIIRPKWFLDC